MLLTRCQVGIWAWRSTGPWLHLPFVLSLALRQFWQWDNGVVPLSLYIVIPVRVRADFSWALWVLISFRFITWANLNFQKNVHSPAVKALLQFMTEGSLIPKAPQISLIKKPLFGPNITFFLFIRWCCKESNQPWLTWCCWLRIIHVFLARIFIYTFTYCENYALQKFLIKHSVLPLEGDWSYLILKYTVAHL